MSRRLLEFLVVAGCLALCAAARSAVLPFSGELSIELHGPAYTDLLSHQATGGVDVSASGVHLTGANLAAGAFSASPLVRDITHSSLGPIGGVALSASNDAAAFVESAGGALRGTMRLQGVLKLCVFAPCSEALANVALPLSIIGVGGTAFIQGVLNLTVRGAPWTTGTAQVGARSAHGSAHGPASLASSTAQMGGSLNLVSPIFISANIAAAPIIPSFARLSFNLGGTPDCANGLDDDGDGVSDFPSDPGCKNAQDLSEQQIDVACDDGADNDGDTHIDFPADPGCIDLSDLDEHGCNEELVTGPVTIPGPPAAPGFQVLGEDLSARAVSANGSVASGVTACGAFRWSEPDGVGWLGTLGDGGAGDAVSADGSTIVGNSSNASEGQAEAFRWTAATGMVGLGKLSNGTFPTSAAAVSADGSVVVGQARQGGTDVNRGYEAFRWTEAGGMQGLGFLPGHDGSLGTGISGDGSIIVGNSHVAIQAGATSEAFVSTDGAGMIGLGDLGHTTTPRSFANAISLDGSTVVGSAQRGQGGLLVPFRWTAAEGMTELALPSGGNGFAMAATANGSVVLGVDVLGGGGYYLWDRRGNRRLLVSNSNPSTQNSVFTAPALAFDLSGWTNVNVQGFSADGLTLVGNGTHLGRSKAWVAVIAACIDGIDDDDDGRIDFPSDPGCSSATDLSERSATLTCDNGVDDDADGDADFPDDSGCSSLSDATEEFGTTACDDGADNDGDTLVDHPPDPGCESLLDDDETDPEAACDDGLDNDGDGVADFPADPGCASAVDTSERSDALACDNGNDDDGDGFVDFPADPNCTSPSDSSEASKCNNGIDDDRDGFIDHPADPGCSSATSDREYAMCQDGIDNQGDGTIDFDGGASVNGGIPLGPPDPKCIHAYQHRETPACGLGVELVIAFAALRRRRSKSGYGVPIQ